MTEGRPPPHDDVANGLGPLVYSPDSNKSVPLQPGGDDVAFAEREHRVAPRGALSGRDEAALPVSGCPNSGGHPRRDAVVVPMRRAMNRWHVLASQNVASLPTRSAGLAGPASFSPAVPVGTWLGWRNGRRAGLRISYLPRCPGSSPGPSTGESLLTNWRILHTLRVHRGVRIAAGNGAGVLANAAPLSVLGTTARVESQRQRARPKSAVRTQAVRATTLGSQSERRSRAIPSQHAPVVPHAAGCGTTRC